MIKIGMLIAERYEIIEKIGMGGMSDVYRAKCHKLNRFVAVKVLKQEFSENTDFVSKFRVEAQAAAGLMHPNIVNVYDVGEESGFHYIVMELVEGITLKKYIEKKARLSVKEAVSIAIQVSMGIEAAHNNNIIHRDIKPQNIIISKEGKVKVTDFGIAKAATSNTITSSVMGSVHYTSPEQVRGGFSDEKSDIYSLGITLFEMLTGRVPFNGETTVAVAIKHIQEQMPSPRNFVPEIPISVEQIVMKCTQKSPDRRYQYAPELIEDLKRSLISPDEDFVKIDTDDTQGVTKNITNEEFQEIKRHKMSRTGNLAVVEEAAPPVRTGKAKAEQEPEYEMKREEIKQPATAIPIEVSEEELPVRMPKKSSGSSANKNKSKGNGKSSGQSSSKNGKPSGGKQKTSGGKNAGSKSGNPKNASGKNSTTRTSAKKGNGKKGSGQYEEEVDPKMELLTTILIGAATIIIGCVFIYFFAKALGINLFSAEPVTESTTQRSQVEMIGVTNMTADVAKETLTSMGLLTTIEYEESATVPENQVISASVMEGAMIDTGSMVTLVVSSGADGVALPNVVGRTRAEATATLESEGFEVSVTQVNSDTVARDMVISQTPEAESRIARGGTVEIVVSLGAEEVEVQVPDILNQTEEDAIVILGEAGLTGLMVLEEYSDTIEAGRVTYQDYSPGITVNSGTEVKFRVSMGPEQVFFNCLTTVHAPADYAGGDAVIELKGMDGSTIHQVTTSSFPVEINVYNIFAMSQGEIYITYPVNRQEEVTDASGVVSIQTVSVPTTIGPQSVTFTRVQ